MISNAMPDMSPEFLQAIWVRLLDFVEVGAKRISETSESSMSHRKLKWPQMRRTAVRCDET